MILISVFLVILVLGAFRFFNRKNGFSFGDVFSEFILSTMILIMLLAILSWNALGQKVSWIEETRVENIYSIGNKNSFDIEGSGFIFLNISTNSVITYTYVTDTYITDGHSGKIIKTINGDVNIVESNDEIPRIVFRKKVICMQENFITKLFKFDYSWRHVGDYEVPPILYVPEGTIAISQFSLSVDN